MDTVMTTAPHLDESELQTLMQALNEGVEPLAGLTRKLFPSQFVHDFKTLHDAKIPTIRTSRGNRRSRRRRSFAKRL